MRQRNPGTVDLNVGNNDIPGELSEHDQWFIWRWGTTRDGKPTKQPVNPHTGELASSTNPATRGSYEVAVAAYDMFGYPGVGFVFTSGDPYVGVDLDGCHDPGTHEIEERGEVLRRLHRRVFGEAEQKSNEHIERRAGNGLSDHEIIARAMRAT